MSLWQGYSDEAGDRDVRDDDGDEYISKSNRNDVKKAEASLENLPERYKLSERQKGLMYSSEIVKVKQ